MLEFWILEAKVLITSEVRRWPVCRVGGAKRDGAVSAGGVEGKVSGVNQNMYIYPSSSCSETGFAISASNSAVVSGLVDVGMRERNCPVREEGSRIIGGRFVLV